MDVITQIKRGKWGQSSSLPTHAFSLMFTLEKWKLCTVLTTLSPSPLGLQNLTGAHAGKKLFMLALKMGEVF